MTPPLQRVMITICLVATICLTRPAAGGSSTLAVPEGSTEALPQQIREWLYGERRSTPLPSIWRFNQDVVEQMRGQVPVAPEQRGNRGLSR